MDVVASAVGPTLTPVKKAVKDEESPAMQVEVKDEGESAAVKMRLAASIFVGDFLHNLSDGFFIAAAF